MDKFGLFGNTAPKIKSTTICKYWPTITQQFFDNPLAAVNTLVSLKM